jgi:hypothetical protein
VIIDKSIANPTITSLEFYVQPNASLIAMAIAKSNDQVIVKSANFDTESTSLLSIPANIDAWPCDHLKAVLARDAAENWSGAHIGETFTVRGHIDWWQSAISPFLGVIVPALKPRGRGFAHVYLSFKHPLRW